MTDIEQIKEKIDIVSFIGEYVALKKTGANFKGLCPFHNEKTPSFVVSPERQIWHCFGGCNDGGDVFKFLMRVENIEFPEALKILAKRAGVKLSENVTQTRSAEIRERLYEINHMAAEFYNYILTTHPLGQKARDYLKERRISDSSIKLFTIGYAPASWDSLTKFLLKKKYSTEDLFSAGLTSRSGIGNVFDRFRGRVIFTLKDSRGNVVGFAGRLMDPNAKEAKYINTAETPVYIKGDVLYGLDITKEEIKKEGFAVFVEGEIDCIASYQAGVRNVVAIKGSALTDGQIKLIKRYTENIYLSLDSDFAGDSAVHRGILAADAAGLNIKVVTFSEAKDPDELIKKDQTLWHKAVKNAVNFYDFVIDSAVAKIDKGDVNSTKKAVAEIAKYLEPIDNLVVKDHYLRKLASMIDMDTDDLKTQLAKEFRKGALFPRTPTTENPDTQNGSVMRSRIEALEEYLIATLLQSSNPADFLLIASIRLRIEDFTNPVLGKIYQILVSLVDNPKSDVALPGKFEINQMAKLIPPEIEDTFNRLYLLELRIDLTKKTEVMGEVQNCVWEIKELSLRDKLKKISGEIKKSQNSENLEKDFAAATADLQKLMEQKALVYSSN